MSIRAKMRCNSVAEGKSSVNEAGEGTKYSETVYLTAVYGQDGSANASWAKATPNGSVCLTIDNPDAWGQFKVGGYYFVDFCETSENA